MCIARISCLHTISIAERVREKALISGGNADILAATKEIILLLLCICRHMYRHIGSWLSIPGCLGNCYDLCGEREIDYWRSAMNNNISTLKHCTLLWPGAFKWTSTINSDSHGYVDTTTNHIELIFREEPTWISNDSVHVRNDGVCNHRHWP